MRFSQYFELDLPQAALDFVDVDLETDTPLFVDPYALSTRTDAFSVACAESVSNFFQELITAIRGSDRQKSLRLLSQLHEPNETCLGLSTGRSSGRGVGGLQSSQLHDSLSRSTAVKTGFVQDLADCELVVEGIGPDKISDITTNLIRKQLVEYTQAQCAAHGIQLTGTVPAGPTWNAATLRWDNEYVRLPVVNDRKIVLVPKFAVRWNTSLSHREYYNRFVLNFIQFNPDLFGGLAHLARSRRGTILRKELQEAFPCGKAFLLKFSQEHPDVFEDYKDAKAETPPPSHEDLQQTDRAELGRYFAKALQAVPLGRAGETRYHRLIAAILSYLFYPNLVTPEIEEDINEGRKRIDITYVNAAFSGLFRRFTEVTGRPAIKLVAECKNYSTDVANPEVDQVLGRFASHRSWLGFLMSRTIEDQDRLLKRCRDVARDHQGYIVALDDSDVLKMLEIDGRDGDAGVRDYLEMKFNLLTR
jgi:hypothetical protein